MYKNGTVTYQQLEDFICEENFFIEGVGKSHKTFLHKFTDSIIILPNETGEKKVPPSVAAGVFKNMLENNIVSQDTIDNFAHYHLKLPLGVVENVSQIKENWELK